MKRVYATILTLCIVVGLLSGTAHADSWDDLIADYFQPKTSYAVTGGNIYFNLATGTVYGADRIITEATIPSSIEGVAVTTIGKDAFGACKYLTSVTLPTSVTTIGETAFRGCAFSSIAIPNGVTTIGDGAFKASALKTITIPNSVTSIGKEAFKDCKSLTAVSIADSVTTIGWTAFSGCNLLTDVKLPSNLSRIEGELFESCTILENIIIPDGVTFIGERAFSGCMKLNNITIPSNVTHMSTMLFLTCISLTDIYYPGTEEQWYAIEAYRDTIPSYTIVHFNSTAHKSAPGSEPASPAAQVATATPTSSKVLVDGSNVAFDAYNIADNNYFKLRDLAYVLNGTDKQFEVAWDESANAISLVSGQPYTAVGGEMESKSAGTQAAKTTTSKILLDGKEISLTAYNIGDNNYFKLRDVGETFDFGVDWDETSQTIVIETSKGYTAG